MTDQSAPTPETPEPECPNCGMTDIMPWPDPDNPAAIQAVCQGCGMRGPFTDAAENAIRALDALARAAPTVNARAAAEAVSVLFKRAEAIHTTPPTTAEIALEIGKHLATPAQPAPAEGDWVLVPREPVDASKQRSDFEEWAARGFGPELPLNRVSGHWDYESEKTHAAWCAWWSARLTAPRDGATWAQQQSADDGLAQKAGSATSRTCRCEETRRLVDNQALDAGLWFISETAAEAYLQQELRRLHAVIEGSTSDEIAE